MTRFLTSLAAFVFVVALIAPAAQAPNMTGKWVFDVQTEAGAGSPTFEFKQDGEKLTGKYTGAFGSADLTGTVKGNDVKFSFSADAGGQAVTSTYEGTLEGKDSIKGKLDIAGLGSGTFTGKRQ
jgi:hypothetical protein